MTIERVVLIGPRGAGKTVVGRRLAALLALPFVDADEAVEAEAGVAIDELLAQGRLRPFERGVLKRLLGAPRGVVAAGGGAVLWSGFRRAAQGWSVVWLDADPEQLAARIRGDRDRRRPSLTGRPPAEEIHELARRRRGRYAAAASHRVDTGPLTVDEAARAVLRLLRNDAQPEARSSD